MVYLSLDLDAFYCAVEEHYDPTLKGEAFCVYQKQIVCTLSYAARRLGIKKLDNAQQVRARYPDMRMVNGESLSRYRAAGTMLINWLREFVKGPIERLGLEELRCDISTAVRAAVQDLGLDELDLDELPDEAGEGLTVRLFDTEIRLDDFFFGFTGKTVPEGYDRFYKGRDKLDYYLGGHVAQYIREKMLLETGYSCSIGVASSISLAKIVCGVNKPGGVSVLWPGHEQAFLDEVPLRKVPGFGSRTTQALAPYGLDSASTVREFHDSVPGPEVVSDELWELTWCREKSVLSDWRLPSQVTVEETWATYITASQAPEEAAKLVDSLLSQAEIDIAVDGTWQAIPSHVRVAIIRYQESKRHSRSQRLPVRPDSPQFSKEVGRIASRLAIELAKDPIRLLNVGLIFPSVDL